MNRHRNSFKFAGLVKMPAALHKRKRNGGRETMVAIQFVLYTLSTNQKIHHLDILLQQHKSAEFPILLKNWIADKIIIFNSSYNLR